MDRIIFKRDQSQQKFNPQKITDAISQAMLASNEGGVDYAGAITMKVIEKLNNKQKNDPRYIPNVEEIQDLVEEELMSSSFLKTAKAYIIYRNKQAVKRERNIFSKRLNLSLTNTQSYMSMFPRLGILIGFIRNSTLQVIFKILKQSLPIGKEVL